MKFIFVIVINFLLVFPSALNAKTNCSKNILCIETIKMKNEVNFYAINKKLYKVSFRINVTKQNMESDIIFPATFVLNGYERRFLFSLKFGREKWNYNYHYDWERGDMGAEHEEDYIYRLPYLIGSKFRISQSCNGEFTHFGKSQYAIDFKMPVNTPICAAREGIVVDIKEDSDIGGNSKKYKDHANYILIEHSDGTIGEYYHLKHNGVMVQSGQSVQKGDLIGYSGNTGYTRGSHLHFVIRSTNDGKNCISYPAQFATNKGLVKCPKKDTYHTAD
ncbi:MAG: M23 family metallopeptidase [Desulfobacteraceae bacterium]|nr:M23 family metallopeptidase [Desulfobacteraceae bacterium]